MSELIEHQLNQLNDQTICIVRPYFGFQSDSWIGRLSVLQHKYPLEFHFGTGQGVAILFIADDVVRIDPPQDVDNSLIIIRLKGPADYTRPYQPATSPLAV